MKLWLFPLYQCTSYFHEFVLVESRCPFQYPIRRLIVRSRKIALNFDRHLGSTAAEVSVGQFWIQISRLRDLTRSNDKTSYQILKRDPCVVRPKPFMKLKIDKNTWYSKYSQTNCSFVYVIRILHCVKMKSRRHDADWLQKTQSLDMNLLSSVNLILGSSTSFLKEMEIVVNV